MKESIAIEILDESNRWLRIVSGVLNNGQSIARALKDNKRIYPKYRVRAVGSTSGSLYDMLP